MTEPDEAQRLRQEQRERELREQALSETASEPSEADEHARRADKAQYLRRKLEEREQSEAGEPE